MITPGAFANSDSASTFSVTGHTLHQFSVSRIPVAVIDLGNGQVVINQPVNLYQALGGGGAAEIAFGRSRGVFVSVGVGGTSAAFMLANRAHGALLGTMTISPATTIVPADCLEPL